MSRALAALLLVFAVVTRAGAHSVPIDPSVNSCTITLGDPATGTAALTAAGAPPFRATYDRTASTTQLCEADATFPQTRCAAGVTARAVVDGGGAPWGTLAFPAVFVMGFTAVGDFIAPAPVSLTLVPTGGAATAVPVVPTTGLAAVGSTVVSGSALDATGNFTLVASADLSALGITPSPAALVMHCQAAPRPDADQFTLTDRFVQLGGKLKKGTLALHAQLRSTADAVPSFTGTPVLLEVRSGETVLATMDVPGGLTGSGKKFTGTTTDGNSRIRLKVVRRGSSIQYAFAMRGAATAAGLTGKVSIDAALLAGGRLARGSGTLRIKGGG